MSHTMHSFRKFGIYSLPVLLLVIAGTLLMALLYYPAPVAVAAVESRSPGVMNQRDWQARADAVFAAMLADALRQHRLERDTRARILMYEYPRNPFPAEQPALLPIAPPVGENAEGHSTRSGLIQL